MKRLVKTYILFHAPWGLAALLRVDSEKINLLEKNLASENVCSGGVSHSRLRCFNSSLFLSSPDVLKVSYCDRYLSVVCHPTVNNFSKGHLLLSQWPDFKMISQKCLFYQKSLNRSAPMYKMAVKAKNRRTLKWHLLLPNGPISK